MATDYTAIITLALQGLNASLALIAELKAQSGMTDDQLLALAESQDKATRDKIAAFLKTL